MVTAPMTEKTPSRAVQTNTILIARWIVQGLALGITGLSLWWAPPPPVTHRTLAVMLALVLLSAACSPRPWPHRLITFFGGVALATVCWLSASTGWTCRWLTSDMPRIAPIVFGVSVLTGIVLYCVRFPVAHNRLFRSAVLGSGLFVGVVGTIFFLVINYRPPFNALYLIERYQLEGFLAGITMISSACWVGGIAMAHHGKGWRVFPAALAIFLGIGCVLWTWR